MKKVIMITLVFFIFSFNAVAQEAVSYEYAEIVTVQKLSKSKADFKSIYLNNSSDESLSANEIEELKNNSVLLKFMNERKWEFIERIAVQPGNTAPAWISYFFRKKIN